MVASAIIIVSTVLSGAATHYHLPGGPLYCAHRLGEPLTYSRDTGVWFALDASGYESFANCGDVLSVRFESGEALIGRALDAGRLKGWEIDTDADGQRDTPLVIDIPMLWAPDDGKRSWRVEVANLTAMLDKFPIQ